MLVTDFVSTFFEVQDDDGFVLCETTPSLYPIHPQLEKLAVDVPVLRFEYGYPEGAEAVVDRVRRTLYGEDSRGETASGGPTPIPKGWAAATTGNSRLPTIGSSPASRASPK